MTSAPAVDRIPVTVIGGYLGAGKTTLVNHLLRAREGRRIAVLVNDFGELSIDDDLIESTDGNLMRLAGGCICCSFGNDLVAALMGLPDMLPRPEHILVETSGVALPGAVARTLGLLQMLVLDAVVVLADAETLRARAADPYVGDTVLQQLRDADLLVLNKTDLVAPQAFAALQAWLAQVAPSARVLGAQHASLPPAVVMGTGLAALRAGRPRAAGMLAGPMALAPPLQAQQLFESLSLEFSHAVDCAWLAKALGAPELGLVRAKGLLRDLDGAGRVLQLVGARANVSPSAHARLQEGRLVCIALRGRLDRARVMAVLESSRAPRGSAAIRRA